MFSTDPEIIITRESYYISGSPDGMLDGPYETYQGALEAVRERQEEAMERHRALVEGLQHLAPVERRARLP